jgi:type VI secretion system ImpC/EvpB family protein
VDVLSVSAKDVAGRFREAVFEPEMKTLQDPPLGLILADFDFSHQANDLAALAELADMAKVLQAPLVAQASPAFFGLKQLNLLPKINDLPQRLSDGAHAGWQKFQKQEAARWAALTLNRYLQRAPYEGEKVDPAKPETYLWGRGVWLLGASAARAVRESGHALDLSGVRGGQFKGLPARPYPKAANQTVPLSAEVPVPEQMALELSRAGFMTLVGFLGTDAVMLPIAVNVHRSQPGRLTVSGTLGYQLLAGRLAQFCAFLLEELPADAAEALSFLKRSLVEFLGPLAGAAPESAVTVSPAEGKDPDGRTVPLAEIAVLPAARIEGLEFRYVFQLPLRP